MTSALRNKAMTVGAVGIVVILCAGGWTAARSFESPAQAAAKTKAPQPSRITVPVERRSLSADLVVRGAVRYDQPTVVTLAGPVGSELGAGGGSASQLLTRIAERGTRVASGEILAEVAGRPVLLLRGDRPMFRAITPGATGDDVRQLEEALASLGFDPGGRDGVYDAAAQAAVAAFYTSRGYRPQGLTSDEEDKIRQLRKSMLEAQANLDTARVAEDGARKPPKSSAVQEADAAVRAAQDALEAAFRTAETDLAAVKSSVVAAQRALDRATTAKHAADDEQARLAGEKQAADATLAAARSGAPNPATGAPYTVAEIEQLTSVASTAAQSAAQATQTALDAAAAVDGANEQLVTATATLNSTPATSRAAVQSARDALQSAKTRRSELDGPSDTLTSAKATTASAQRSMAQATEDLERALAKSGVSVPAGEVVFAASDSVRVDEVTAKVGEALSGKLMTVTGSRLGVAASISKQDRDLVQVGDTVRIGSTEAGIDTTGTITEIADKAGTDGLDDQHIRIVIAMETQAGSAELLNDLPVRVTIPISSTGDTKVLVVPVAAVTLAADGTSRVDIETDPQADTKTVTVEPGISTDGVVEVAPVEPGALNEGDRVVVGTKQEGES